jgi:single-stranded DNA-binding protein
MGAVMNRVTLIGAVGRYGFVMKQTANGAAVASGSITISEPNKNGQVFESFFLVEVFGQRAETAVVLQPGQPILIDGKLGKRKVKDGSYEVIVSCYAVQALGTVQAAAVAATVTEDEDIPF